MLRVVRGLLGLLVGFAVGVAACVVLILLFSGNTHDKSAEMAMTAAFVGGPLGAVIGLIAGFSWRSRSTVLHAPSSEAADDHPG